MPLYHTDLFIATCGGHGTHPVSSPSTFTPLSVHCMLDPHCWTLNEASIVSGPFFLSFCRIWSSPDTTMSLFLRWPGHCRGQQAIAAYSQLVHTLTTLFWEEFWRNFQCSVSPSHSSVLPYRFYCVYEERFSQPAVGSLWISFPGNHGSRICCCSKTHFIFIFTVSVLIARPAFIRLRITLSCMWANK